MEAFEGWLERRKNLWRLYVRLNFCKGAYADGSPKPPSRLFDFFHAALYMDCGCCAALRGLLLGLLAGLLAGLALGGSGG
jgi:hypothetical protein